MIPFLHERRETDARFVCERMRTVATIAARRFIALLRFELEQEGGREKETVEIAWQRGREARVWTFKYHKYGQRRCDKSEFSEPARTYVAIRGSADRKSVV